MLKQHTHTQQCHQHHLCNPTTTAVSHCSQGGNGGQRSNGQGMASTPPHRSSTLNKERGCGWQRGWPRRGRGQCRGGGQQQRGEDNDQTTRTTRMGTTGIQWKDANERRTTTGTRKGRTAMARTTTTTTWSPMTMPTIDGPSANPHHCEQMLAGWTTGATDGCEDGMRKWTMTGRITNGRKRQRKVWATRKGGNTPTCSGGWVLQTTTWARGHGGRWMTRKRITTRPPPSHSLVRWQHFLID